MIFPPNAFLIWAKDRTIHLKILQLSFTPFFALQSLFVSMSHPSCFLNTFPVCPSSPFSGINSVPINSHPVRTRVPLLWLQSLFPSGLLPTLGRNYLSCKWCFSPVYNLSMPLTACILGSKSKLFTMKPCVVPRPHPPLCSITCVNSNHQDRPTSTCLHTMCVFRLKGPTSSSLCP